MINDSKAKEDNGGSSGGMSQFEQLRDEKPLPLAQEFWLFVKENKKWWLIPIIVAFLLLGLIVALGSTGAAPFIYPLF